MAQLIASVATILVFIHLILGACAYLILLERKIAAWVQDRTGPNRVGFGFGVLPFKHHAWGLGQPLADGIKLMVKEDYTPPHVERGLFILAPIVAVIPALMAWAVIPWGGVLKVPFTDVAVQVCAAPINIGVVYILGLGSLAVYGVTLAGYASNNKYAFLGGLRATAQMLSYEIPMGLCVLVVILMSGTTHAELICQTQSQNGWNILYHPLLAVIFYACVLAECNRAPFDLAESEQELVGGFHTEYSSMKWALFFLGEYAHMITGSATFALLFLGGWDIPFISEPAVGGVGWMLAKVGCYITKVFVMLFLMMLVRWSLPRFRFDQLMHLAWRGLIPLALAVLVASSTLVYLRPEGVDRVWWNLTMPVANLGVCLLGMLVYPMVPKGPPVNRRVPLAGSRFSPVVEA